MRSGEKASFRWITIPNGREMGGDEVFDPVQMQMLYDLGYRMAASGGGWLVHRAARGNALQP